MPDERRKLTESEFIEWAKRERWTPTEAVYVLHGQIPEPCSMDDLIERFPDSRRLLERVEEDQRLTDKRAVPKPGVRPASPDSWISRVCGIGEYDELWEHIAGPWRFIYTVKFSEPALGEVVGEKMGYSYLRWCYLKNTKLPARDLGMYTLDLSRRGLNSTATEQLRQLLLMIVPGEDAAKTETTRVSTRFFIDNFPHELFDLDRRCVEIREWTAKYPRIAAWLAGGTLNTRGPMPRAGTNTRAPKINGPLQAFISSIVPKLAAPTTGALKDYLRENRADSRLGDDMEPLEGVSGCENVYLDGQKLVWIDREAKEDSRSMRSLERYLERCKKPKP